MHSMYRYPFIQVPMHMYPFVHVPFVCPSVRLSIHLICTFFNVSTLSSLLPDATNLARSKGSADAEYYTAVKLSEANKVCCYITPHTALHTTLHTAHHARHHTAHHTAHHTTHYTAHHTALHTKLHYTLHCTPHCTAHCTTH